jgi:beta-lactamase class A
MAQLLTRIWQLECVRPDLDERMLRILSGSYWREEMLSSFPPTAQVFSKQGAVNQSRSEVVLVEAPRGPFVLCVITKGQEDTSWEHGNAGFVLLRGIAKMCWEHNAGTEQQ